MAHFRLAGYSGVQGDISLAILSPQFNSDQFVENDSIFEADTLRLGKSFKSRLKSQSFSFLTIHYDIIFEQDTVDTINRFLGTKIIMPKFKPQETTWLVV